MDKKGKIIAVSIIFLCLASLIFPGGFNITLTPKSPQTGWDATIDQTSLSGGAGTDTNIIESPAGQAKLDIKKSTGNWQADFNFLDTSSWDSNLILQIRRTGPGTGGTVSGGTNYITLNTTSQTLFTGTGDVNNIPMQYRIPAGMVSQGITANSTAWTVTVMVTVTDGL